MVRDPQSWCDARYEAWRRFVETIRIALGKFVYDRDPKINTRQGGDGLGRTKVSCDVGSALVCQLKTGSAI